MMSRKYSTAIGLSEPDEALPDKLQPLDRCTDPADFTNPFSANVEALDIVKKAVGSLDVGFTVAKLDGKILFTNRAEAEMHGYEAEELIGRNISMFYPPPLWGPIHERLLIHGSWKGESVNFGKKEKLFPVRLIINLVRDDNGFPVRIISICEDITKKKRAEDALFMKRLAEAYVEVANDANEELATEIAERKRAEEKIREQTALIDMTREQAALLDVTQDAIIVRDLAGIILFWNSAAQSLYGRMPQEVVGENIRDIINEPDAEKASEAFKRVVKDGKWLGELRQTAQSGEEIIVESRWTLIKNSYGKPKSILIANTNITEKKELQAQVLRTQRMESIGTLAGGIAHDLNNVLTPILMAIQLLEKRVSDETGRKVLARIESSALRGADLIKQVLLFARGYDGKHESVQLKQVISEMTKMANETFPKSIEISCQMPEDLWNISGNVTQLHQVLMNLCVNARDAMPNGGNLDVSAENFWADQQYAQMNVEAKDGSYVVVTVSDTGTGISPEHMEKIFDPFFTTKELGKGTGLGLTTVMGIVKSHGGFVKIESKAGAGTRIKIYFPALFEADQQPSESESSMLYVGKGELILVVDDEESIREGIKATLESCGYNALTAGDGVEAASLCLKRKNEIDLVLMDVMMPIMDGASTAAVLKNIDSEVKIVALSGNLPTEKQNQLASLGVQNVLMKPFTRRALLKAMREEFSRKDTNEY